MYRKSVQNHDCDKHPKITEIDDAGLKLYNRCSGARQQNFRQQILKFSIYVKLHFAC